MKTTLSINERPISAHGPAVYPMGLGCMGMSGMYGAADEAESIATIQAAIDARVNLLDTGDFYGNGHNELLIARAIRGRRDRVVLSVKFGALRTPDGGWGGIDNRPAALKNFLTYSLTRLGVDYIDIYRPSRLDPTVPIEDTVGALADLVRSGYIRYIGLSEVGPATIQRAHAVHPICDVQLEYSLVTRGIEARILPLLRQLGIGVTAYGVLSRGLLSGSSVDGARDFRAHLPRFSEAHRENNRVLVDKLTQFAAARQITTTQLAVAWVLHKSSSLVPVVGARTQKQLSETLNALSVRLNPDEIAALEALVSSCPEVGARYPEQQMRLLDSERAES